MNTETFALVSGMVAELGEEMGFPALRNPTAQTELFGGENGIDSLSIVRLVAQIEMAAGEKFGKPVVLADSRAMSRRNSPFRTVGSLTELLQERLAE